ncbi:MAG TPA: DJ-1/PfpI family protein, partial [Paludibacter sp.]
MQTFVFLADGFEEIEAIAAIDILRRANIEVTTISISTSKEVQGAHGIIV